MTTASSQEKSTLRKLRVLGWFTLTSCSSKLLVASFLPLVFSPQAFAAWPAAALVEAPAWLREEEYAAPAARQVRSCLAGLVDDWSRQAAGYLAVLLEDDWVQGDWPQQAAGYLAVLPEDDWVQGDWPQRVAGYLAVPPEDDWVQDGWSRQVAGYLAVPPEDDWVPDDWSRQVAGYLAVLLEDDSPRQEACC